MTTRKASTKTLLEDKESFYGVEDFERDMEREYGPLTFGRLLESYRKCEELTQEQLGKMVGLSRANICDLEKGRKIPSLKRASALANAFGVSEKQWVEIALQDQLRKEKLDFKVFIT